MTKSTLLLVDDNSRSLKLLDAICQSEGYTTLLANDGLEAMEILLHQRVHLVITDILMPNVDGYYLCYKIRNHERLKDIPIVIYTATYTSVSEEKIAKDMGADVFIRKPATRKDILQAIDNLLKTTGKRPSSISSSGTFEVMHQYSSDLVSKLEQRNIALEEIRQNLEQKVYERTQELQATNEELLASNEELKAANEELSAINDKLTEASQLIQHQAEIIVRQKDEQLNRVLDSSDHFIWSLDLTGKGQDYMSRSVEKVVGEPAESFLKKRDEWWKIVYPPDLEKWYAARERLSQFGHAEEIVRFVDSKGKIRWIDAKYWITKDENGTPQRTEGISSDITPIKEAEMALHNERKLLRSLIDNMPDFIFVKDKQFRHILNNKAIIELFGAANEEETLGKSLFDYFGEGASKYAEDDKLVMNTGLSIVNKEETIENTEGNILTLLTTKVPLRDDEGGIIGIAGISRDITEHKKHQQELRQYQENLDIIFSSTQEEILLLDHQGKIVLFNNALENFLTKTTGKKPLIGQWLWDITLPERREIAKTLFARVLKGESIFTEAVFNTPEGPMTHELHYEPIIINDAIKYVSLISVDITARKKGERELARSRYLLDKAYEVAQIGYWSFDPETNHTEWNDQARQIFGLPPDFEAASERYLSLVHSDEREYVKAIKSQTVAERKSYSIDYRIIRTRDSAIRWIHERADFVTRDDNAPILIGIVHDITERKETEQELKLLHNQLLFHIENTPLGFIEWDKDLKVKSWSTRAEEIFGWTQKEFLESGKTGFGQVYEKDQPWVYEIAKQLVAGSLERNKTQHRNVKKDGTVIWCEWFNSVMRDNEGKIISIMSLVQDVTERKAMEEVLTEYNERYEILSKATNDAIWDWDIEHDFTIWNHGLETIFGYPTREITSVKTWWKDKIHPLDHQRVLQGIQTAFAEQQVNWTAQYQYRCSDGAYKHVLDRAYIIYRDSIPTRVIGTMQDITAQKEFESSITAIARELSELIENANTPIFGTDRNQYINEWNKVTEQLTGYTKNEVLGKELSRYIKTDQQNYFKDILSQVTSDNPQSNLEIPLTTKHQKDLIILLNATPRRNSHRQITGTLLVGQNITELIEYRQNLEAKVTERTRELNEALQKEKYLVEMKSRFVSIASHEFRTPLSTIALVSGFLKKHRGKITADEFDLKLQTIEKQVNHMTYLLDDILTIGKSEAGKIKTQYTAVNLTAFFGQTVREVEESAKTHSIKMKSEVSVKEFTSDEKLLRNIVINLLTNAIKFSPGARSVDLRISDSPGHLVIEVEDKGIGIAEEDLANIFTAFNRGSNVGTIQGTGLGLSIVKKAIDLLNGEIRIQSKPGHGTIFTVTLPIQKL